MKISASTTATLQCGTLLDSGAPTGRMPAPSKWAKHLTVQFIYEITLNNKAINGFIFLGEERVATYTMIFCFGVATLGKLLFW